MLGCGAQLRHAENFWSKSLQTLSRHCEGTEVCNIEINMGVSLIWEPVVRLEINENQKEANPLKWSPNFETPSYRPSVFASSLAEEGASMSLSLPVRHFAHPCLELTTLSGGSFHN